MSRSMTGYGRGECEHENRKYLIEIKAVNAKYCETRIHFPRELLSLEHNTAKKVKSRIARGRIDIFLKIERDSSSSQPKLNTETAKAYADVLKQLKETCALSGDLSIAHLLTFKDIIGQDDKATLVEDHAEPLAEALETALKQLIAMGQKEWQELKQDMLERLGNVEKALQVVEQKRQSSVASIQQRLRERVDKLVSDINLNQDRLEQEIAVMVDKSDIHEEIIRLKAHLKSIVALLNRDGTKGRELDFATQEINREINTIGSKAQDFDITQTVINMKSEIEKFREQVQNVE